MQAFMVKAMAYLVVDIEILSQRVASSSYGAIVGLVDGIIEVGQVGGCPFQRHGEPDAGRVQPVARLSGAEEDPPGRKVPLWGWGKRVSVEPKEVDDCRSRWFAVVRCKDLITVIGAQLWSTRKAWTGKLSCLHGKGHLR